MTVLLSGQKCTFHDALQTINTSFIQAKMLRETGKHEQRGLLFKRMLKREESIKDEIRAIQIDRV